ncbi:MAG: 30S ribosomal protein S8 [Eubacteriales bacterium]|nr:30S ribosomal protein S8 [Eubacteriales bacterium]HBI56955.1 30S ribosomal protein S8 [Bacillota bacterium]MDD3072859.1 30S ribosomal protein S8 [Eubacteriales bacterium]MDD4078673.1 30S ribosomal protein S8 [Eubacteriales bacterium]MDD4768184.1 30S ribosomal protein S8 [Eubacteriales bacterium]
MTMTDPIADMLTRIRNANTALHTSVEIPASKIKIALAEALKEEGYIANFEVVEDNKQGIIRITLRYENGKRRIITGIKRISKPGLRVYANKDEIPRVLGGLGIAIISTSQGVMVDRKARAAGLGGEVLCYVW